jgi:nucleoside-diphosphate-sugar epimerase
MSDTVLVTGAFGLVGSATVRQLIADGRKVVATDLDTPANRKAAARLTGLCNLRTRWADLTDADDVDALIREARPAAIVHLAAVIPPFCYAHRALARAVNVDATKSLVRSAQSLSQPPRFVQASSTAVYGARNPHRTNDLLRPCTPTRPCDNYGTHKVEAEKIIRDSGLQWLILRLGGVAFTEFRLDMNRDLLFFEGMLPTDGRIQTVDVRDVAAALVSATTVDVTGEVLVIGGDDSHRNMQGDLVPAVTRAIGLADVLPAGRPGDPGSATDWFATDWMDSSRAQSLLSFQRHSWPDMLAEMAENVGWKRYPLRIAAPLAAQYFRRRALRSGRPNGYGDPWGEIRKRWGEPSPDTPDAAAR